MDARTVGRRTGQADRSADLSRETVRRRLAENDLKPWRKDMWCIPQVDAEYVARMENVLDLYAEAPIPSIRSFVSMRAQPNSSARFGSRSGSQWTDRALDCEYKRNGTANLFVFLDAHRPWRKVKVTDSRTAIDFAICMRELTDVDFPTAERIRVVVDNLSTHSAGALYQAFQHAKRDACCAGWSSIMSPSMRAG